MSLDCRPRAQRERSTASLTVRALIVGCLGFAVLATGTRAGGHASPVLAAAGANMRATPDVVLAAGQLLDQLTIDEGSSSAKLGTQTLTEGVAYTLVVSGTGTYSNVEKMDALYCLSAMNSGACFSTPPAREAYMVAVGTSNGSMGVIDAFQHKSPNPDPSCYNLSCPDGLAYQSNHTYTTTFYPPATGVLKAQGDTATLGYPHDPPDTGKFTVKVYGTPAKPHVGSVTPDTAGPHGGTPFTIDGHGFGKAGGDASVVFIPAQGGNPEDAEVATGVKVVSDNKITGDVPPESKYVKSHDGHAKVSVVVGSTASNNVLFDYDIHVGSVSPDTAGPHGGTPITIHGMGFGKTGSHDTVVFIPAQGGDASDAAVAANVQVKSDTKIVADVPAEEHYLKSHNGHAKVSVVAASVPSNSVPFDYDVHVDSISPNSGKPHGGTPVTILGTGFGSAGSHDTVVFIPAQGGNPSDAEVATNVQVLSDTKITAHVPAAGSYIKSHGGHAKVSVVVASVPSNNVPFTYR